MLSWKWVKVRNKEEWTCDVCRICGDKKCCERPAKWLKHPNVRLSPAQKSLRFSHEGHISDIALCDLCFDAHKDRVIQEHTERQ